jgi:hypothetical protein
MKRGFPSAVVAVHEPSLVYSKCNFLYMYIKLGTVTFWPVGINLELQTITDLAPKWKMTYLIRTMNRVRYIIKKTISFWIFEIYDKPVAVPGPRTGGGTASWTGWDGGTLTRGRPGGPRARHFIHKSCKHKADIK